MVRALALVTVAFLLGGCGSMHDWVRVQAASDWSCEPGDVDVVPLDSMEAQAVGCGRRATYRVRGYGDVERVGSIEVVDQSRINKE
jgi:hypothetical protein